MDPNDAVPIESIANNLSSTQEVEHYSSVKVAEREKVIVKGGKVYAFFKRAFDIVSSFLVICLLSWLLLILCIVVKLSSKGPIIFADKRIGKNGKEISVYKFRSMYVDAESNLEKYLSKEQIEIWLRERKLDNDPRITLVGKFLRKTSLDELPQLFNILFGSLSVVGPRPISQRELDENFSEYEKSILLMTRPGLTGYWQVFGRGKTDFDSGVRQKQELEYFTKRSFWFDLKLIFKTIPVVLNHKGAK